MLTSSIESLEAALSEPTPAVLEMFSRLPGDIVFLGVSGKMGPSMARMARRAAEQTHTPRRIWGVSRFSDLTMGEQLRAWGIETITADLLDEATVAALPEAPLVVFMAGMKFGASGNEPLTWGMNTWLPSVVSKRYRHSRIAAFSTGNVYGLAETACNESAPCQPVGEYAMSCLGRERIFQYFSQTLGTRTSLIRLNYASDLRYGVMVDIAMKVMADQPVDLSMGRFNTIWQRDANAYSLLALEEAQSPAQILNLTGKRCLDVRDVAERFGRLFGKSVSFVGEPSATALLNDSSALFARHGSPTVDEDELIEMTAKWLLAGLPLLNKPTHFESRSGQF